MEFWCAKIMCFVDTYVLQNFPSEKLYQSLHTFSNTGYYYFSSLLMGEARKLCVVLFYISLITSENIFLYLSAIY